MTVTEMQEMEEGARNLYLSSEYVDTMSLDTFLAVYKMGYFAKGINPKDSEKISVSYMDQGITGKVERFLEIPLSEVKRILSLCKGNEVERIRALRLYVQEVYGVLPRLKWAFSIVRILCIWNKEGEK